jgi:hypothetical protein
MNVDQVVQQEWARETIVIAEVLPQGHFVQHKSHMTWPSIEPGVPRWKPRTNQLHSGTMQFGKAMTTWNFKKVKCDTDWSLK